MVSVRPIAADELDEACQGMAWRPCRRHRERAEHQEAGRALYLVAWQGTAAAGHVFLKWDPSLRGPQAREVDCPELEDFFVDPERRRRGIGRALLSAVEKEARDRGFPRLGLATGVEDGYAAARHLYAEHGYEDAGYGTFWLSWRGVDDHGRPQGGGDAHVYLVKSLR